MSSKNTSDTHHSDSESHTSTSSKESQKPEQSSPPAEKVDPEPQAKLNSEADIAALASSPCTCRCGGCCCHGTSEPQHCVRCHGNYTLNHPEACAVPHVYDDSKSDGFYNLGIVAPSACCGIYVSSSEFNKGEGEWVLPSPCFMGWHTTDVCAVEEQYNGVNVLRCDPDPGGKCRRVRMKHSANYQPLFNIRVKYIKNDREDHQRHLKRKREEINDDDEFEEMFGVEAEEKGEEEDEEEEEDKEDKGEDESL